MTHTEIELGLAGAEQLSLPYEGQAHFASTGPAGTRCLGCTYWVTGRGRALKRPCGKFSATTGVITKLVRGSALTCRHFEEKE